MRLPLAWFLVLALLERSPCKLEKLLDESLRSALTGFGRIWDGRLTEACPMLFLPKIQCTVVVEEVPRRCNSYTPSYCCE